MVKNHINKVFLFAFRLAKCSKSPVQSGNISNSWKARSIIPICKPCKLAGDGNFDHASNQYSFRRAHSTTTDLEIITHVANGFNKQRTCNQSVAELVF